MHLNSGVTSLLVRVASVTFLLPALSLSGYSLAQEAVQVEGVEVRRVELADEVPLVGSVTARRISLLSSQVQGLVQDLRVNVGDQVEAGQVLLELDDELRRHDRDRLEAQAAQAKAEWEDAQRLLREGQSLSEDAIPASEVRGRQAQVAITQAQWRVAQADVARLDAELKRHQLKAPFNGTISAKLTEEGEWISPGDDVLELVDSDAFWVDFQVSQRYYPRIDGDATLSLSFDAYPGTTFDAAVHRKVPLTRSGGRTFLLRATLEGNEQPAVIPGMSVSGSLTLDATERVVAVPRDALVRYPDGRVTVWVVEDPDWGGMSAVMERSVETGTSNEGMVELRSGVSAGEVVVTVGNEALQVGQQVSLARDEDQSMTQGE